MQIKLIFTKNVLHLASFWKWEFLDLGNGLLVVLTLSTGTPLDGDFFPVIFF